MTRYTPSQARTLADRVLLSWARHHCVPNLSTMRVMRDCATLSPTRAGRCYAAILNSLAGF